MEGKIEARLKKIINKHNAYGVLIDANTNLSANLGIDSFIILQVITEIEEEFNIRFKLTELKECLHFGTLLTLVQSKTKE